MVACRRDANGKKGGGRWLWVVDVLDAEIPVGMRCECVCGGVETDRVVSGRSAGGPEDQS